MTPSIQSQTFKPATNTEFDAVVAEVASQMPIVILAKAVRDAFFKPKAVRRQVTSNGSVRSR